MNGIFTQNKIWRNIARVLLYAVILVFAIYFLLPFVIMVFNSIKSLDEIRSGNLIAFPRHITLEPWKKAWGYAQIGVNPTGLKPYFVNSVMMIVPSVAISVIIGAFNGYILTQWRFKGDSIIFGLLLFSCFIPFQMVLIPMARLLGMLRISGTVGGLVFVHIVYGIGFTTLFFRNAYRAFPASLVQAGKIDGAGFFSIFFRIFLPLSVPIVMVSIIWQFTNVWNDFLFGVSFGGVRSQPMTVALNNLVNSSTGVKEYNVNFAGAIIAALPTLVVYIVSGKYFVQGLMAGAIKE